MQFLESSFSGVRAAVYSLVGEADAARLLLLPMVHIGSPAYYDELRNRLASCDAIIYEGVHSLRGRILSLSYTIVARRKRLALVAQKTALPLNQFRAKLIHADATAEEFSRDWVQIPWRWRIAIYIAVPLLGVYRYFTATRRSLGARLSRDDLASRDDILSDEAVPGFNKAVIQTRDSRLVSRIQATIGQESSRGSLIGIVYGAGHMGAVTEALMAHGKYRVLSADWISVFDYDTDEAPATELG